MNVEVGGATGDTNADDDDDDDDNDDDDDDDDDGTGGGIIDVDDTNGDDNELLVDVDELLVDVEELLVDDDDSSSPCCLSLTARLVASTRLIYFSSLCAALYANNIGSNTVYGVGSNDVHASPALAPKRARTSLFLSSNRKSNGSDPFSSYPSLIRR